MIDNTFGVVFERHDLVQAMTKAHNRFIQAVRNKEDTLKAYFDVNQAFQALLAFDVKHNS